MKIFIKLLLFFLVFILLGWANIELCDWLLHLEKPVVFAHAYITLLQYITWLILVISYTYVLMKLLKRNNYRTLIMTLNGMAVLVITSILTFALNSSIQFGIRYIHSKICCYYGLPLIILSLLFDNLSNSKLQKKQSIDNRKPVILIIILKSALCTVTLLLVQYFFSKLIFLPLTRSLLMRLYDIRTVWFVLGITYSFALYKLMKMYQRRILIMLVNAAVVLLGWALMLILLFCSDIPSVTIALFSASALGIAAVSTFVLAFVFRKVEMPGK